jgi:hypothetical protein
MEIGDEVEAIVDLYAWEEGILVETGTAGEVVQFIPDTGKIIVQFDEGLMNDCVIIPGVRMEISPAEVEPL